jgi:hypothetical protein
MQQACGDNPAQAVESITVEPKRRISPLDWANCRRLLSSLPDPARTMSMMTLAMSCNVSELLGLRGYHLNFTDAPKVIADADMMPPHEIAIREHLYHGRRGSLKTGSRKRNIPMSVKVEAALLALISRQPKAWAGSSGVPDHYRYTAVSRQSQEASSAAPCWQLGPYGHLAHIEAHARHAVERSGLCLTMIASS